MTFIAALRHDRIDAPWVIDGPINGETFLLYVEKILAPTLSPGDVVVLDNLGSHKGKAARAIVRAQRRPTSSSCRPTAPDLNPIEQVFAKLKHLVRKAQPRDVDATWRKVGQPLDLLQARRVRELPRQLRLWFRISESCSSASDPQPRVKAQWIKWTRCPRPLAGSLAFGSLALDQPVDGSIGLCVILRSD